MTSHVTRALLPALLAAAVLAGSCASALAQSVEDGRKAYFAGDTCVFGDMQLIGRVYEPMPLYIVCSIIYFLINYSLSSASRRLEARFVYIRE